MTENANSVVQFAIHIKNGIMINSNGNVKNIVHAKMIIPGILAHVFVIMASI